MGKKTLEGGANIMTFGGYGAAKKSSINPFGGIMDKSSKVKGFDKDPNTEAFIKDRYKEAILGKGESLADKQLKAGLDQSNKQALAFAGSARGTSNPALAFRQAQQIQGEQQADVNQQAAMLRLQEQRNALAGLSNYMTGAENRALNQASSNADLNEKRKNKLFDTFANIGAAAVSDENSKENIKKEDNSADKISNFMDALKSYTYDYKDEKNGQGKQMGVMAQDLEKTQVGSQMVEDTENGKMVDFGKGFGAILASIASLNDKIKKMEGKEK